MKKLLANKKLWVTIGLLMLFILIAVPAVSAATPTPAPTPPPTGAGATPKFITGAVDLIQIATNWLYGIIPVSGIIMFSFYSWQRSHAEDDGEVKQKTKHIKRVLIWTPIALTGSTFVNLATYYLS